VICNITFFVEFLRQNPWFFSGKNQIGVNASCCKVEVVNGASGALFGFFLQNIGNDKFVWSWRLENRALRFFQTIKFEVLLKDVFAIIKFEFFGNFDFLAVYFNQLKFRSQRGSGIYFEICANRPIRLFFKLFDFLSLSTINLKATDWTRPADKPRLTFCHKIGDTCNLQAGRERVWRFARQPDLNPLLLDFWALLQPLL